MKESCQTRRMYGHDYAVPGTYEVTIVVAGRQPQKPKPLSSSLTTTTISLCAQDSWRTGSATLRTTLAAI